jgi:hypothetical protein
LEERAGERRPFLAEVHGEGRGDGQFNLQRCIINV